MPRLVGRLILAVAVLLCLAAAAWAQQTTTAKETKSFEVIAVDGSRLVVRFPEGSRELTVPDDFRFTVDGQQLSVRQLLPGMKGTATITTKTTVTPVTVTEVKNGTVVNVTGSSILVRTPEGFKNFTQGDVDKRGVRIVRDGKPAAVSDFRAGDQLTATIVTTRPPRVVSEKEVNATLAGATAPVGGTAPAPATQTAPTTGATSPAPRKLPKTASPMPAFGLAGLASLMIAMALRRRRQSR